MRPKPHMVALFLVCALPPGPGAGWAADKPTPPPPGTPSAKASSAANVAIPDTARRQFVEARPAIYLAWGAPWGTPGARETAAWSCDDTLATDTLYLTFDPGMDDEVLMGIDATLVFRATPGDTLGPFWDLSRRGANPYNLRIEFEPPPEGTLNPWPLTGVGNVRYDLKGDAGRLDLTYFVQASKGGPILAGSRYFFARVMVRLRKPHLGGCRQPVCVDFDHLLISHKEGSRWINTGQRFTSLNSPGGGACAEHRKRPPSEEPMRFGGHDYLPSGPGGNTQAAPDSTRR